MKNKKINILKYLNAQNKIKTWLFYTKYFIIYHSTYVIKLDTY